MPKIRVKRSAIWRYFSINYQEDGSHAIVKCNKCNLTVPYCKNTTNLWSHIRIRHKNILENELPSQPNKKTNQNHASISWKSSRQRSSTSSKISDISEKYFDLRRDREITRSLIQIIAENVIPFSTVYGKGFTNFIKMLNDKYKIPDRDILISEYLPELYERKCVEMSEILSKATNIHLTTSLCTDSKRGLPFMITIAHFCTNEIQHHKVLQISCLKQMNETTIRENLLKVADTWKIASKIRTVVYNGKSDIVNTNETEWRQIYCFGRTLNLITRNAIRDTEIINEVVNKCRSIVHSFRFNSSVTKLLRKHQLGENSSKISNLFKDTDRWTTVYLLLNNINELRSILSEVFLKVSQKDVPSLTEHEWRIISEMIRVLKPLHEATRELLVDCTVTISKIIPIVHGVEAALKNTDNLSQDVTLFRDNLLTLFDKRFENIEKNPVYAIATFLDPRYKDIAFQSKECVKLAKHLLIQELNYCFNNEKNNSDLHMDKVEIKEENKETNILWAVFDKRVQELQIEFDNCEIYYSLKYELERYSNDYLIYVFYFFFCSLLSFCNY